jgi:hypothetical protein
MYAYSIVFQLMLIAANLACRMAAFSRGLSGFFHQYPLRLPSSVRVAIFSSRPQSVPPCSTLRSILSPTLRRYVKPTVRLRYAARPSSPSYFATDPVIREVLATQKPVLLYKAPGRRLYMIGVYGLACSCIAGGLLTWRWRYGLPKDLPFFVGPTYILVGFIMMAIGIYIFSAPVGRCSSIEVIPSAFKGGPLQLRIKTRLVPWFQDKITTSTFNQASLDQKTWLVTRELQEAERARRQNVAQGLEGVFITTRLSIILGRFIEQKWTSFFLYFKFAVLRFGNVWLEVHGTRYRVDCSGYMREDGKGMFHNVSVESELTAVQPLTV